jgi:prolipoprotein diacylglyceryltransferase
MYEMIKYWFLRYNIARPIGYFYIWQSGFIMASGMFSYIIHNDINYAKTIRTPSGGWLLNIGISVTLAILLTRWGNMFKKAEKDEVKT